MEATESSEMLVTTHKSALVVTLKTAICNNMVGSEGFSLLGYNAV
jgi:hypothetical protein